MLRHGTVFASTSKIVMHSSITKRCKKRFKLFNQSKFTVKYMFDIASRQKITFRPDVFSGTIHPNSYVNVTITFLPVEKKIHYFPLICLILHHNPIIIELYGYCDIQYIHQNYIVFESQFDMGLTTFETYFIDNSRIKRSDQTPVLSFSQNYLTFEKSSTLNPCQMNSVTNHTPYELNLEWEKDIDGIFLINPQSMRISGGKSGQFQFSFNPSHNHGKCYVKDIAAHGIIISSEVKHTFNIIRLMGYRSLNKIECITNSIHNKKQMKKLVNYGKSIITLPPCTPGSSSFTTFLIKNDSEEPLAFQFISPHLDLSISTHFDVKPMLGIIYEKYQIIAVKMFPNTIDAHLYCERWSIKFSENSNSQSLIYIEFQGLAESPKICIGDNNNEINFSPVYPGCQTVQSVFIKNLTRHSIRYIFSHLPPYIILNKLSNIIDDHEIHSLDWIFHPTQPGLYECNILCSIMVLSEYSKTEKPIDMIVHISAMSAIGLLESDLDELNLMEIPYNERRKFNFHIFNSSDVEICFKLTSKLVIGEATFEEFARLEMHPTFECLLPGERQEIIATLVPREIIDIQYHLINPNFGKLTLWRLFKINLLNKIIAELNPNMKKIIDIYIPEIAVSSDSSIVKFLIKNVSSVPASWSIKKNILSSTSEIINEKFNSIHPEFGTVQPKDKVVVTINLSQAIECEQCQWQISLGQNRSIVLAVNHSSRLLYGPHFLLDDVYLGDMNPRYQAFWLYNPTSEDLPYSIDTKAFNVINAQHRSVTLTCIERSGSIPTQTLHPILVKFQPRRLGRFTILLPIIVGDIVTSMIMDGGASVIHQHTKIPRELPYLPRIFYITEVPVYINTDIVILCDIPLCDRVTCTLTLSNQSDSEVFGYEWSYYNIIDIIYMSVIPQKGRIGPRETHSFELIVKTKNKPCRIDVNIACQFINYTAKRIYWRFMDSYDRKVAEIKEQLKSRKNGISFPIAEHPENVPHPPISFYRVLTVCCITLNSKKKDAKSSLNEIVTNSFPTKILSATSEASTAIIRNILHSSMLDIIYLK